MDYVFLLILFVCLICFSTGNVMNGPIGKQMVDTLVESSTNVEVLKRHTKLLLFLFNEILKIEHFHYLFFFYLKS